LGGAHVVVSSDASVLLAAWATTAVIGKGACV